MTFEGVEYVRDRGGFYRCPWSCTDPVYAPHGRKFKGEDRFLLHLEVCKAKPGKVYVAPAPNERKIEGECSDCADPLWTLDPIWQMVDRHVCWDCRKPYLEAGVGYLDSIGLKLPGEYS